MKTTLELVDDSFKCCQQCVRSLVASNLTDDVRKSLIEAIELFRKASLKALTREQQADNSPDQPLLTPKQSGTEPKRN